MTASPELLAKARPIKLFAMDVDGILSDGQIIYDSTGNETKAFYVQDGLGLSALRQHGYILAIITGRDSPMVARRAKELGITHLIQGRDDKFTALSSLADNLGIALSDCAYMGDDLPDVKAIKQAGLGISVPNGCPQAQAAADFITSRTGGCGAVREVCELLLMASGQYDAWIAQFD